MLRNMLLVTVALPPLWTAVSYASGEIALSAAFSKLAMLYVSFGVNCVVALLVMRRVSAMVPAHYSAFRASAIYALASMAVAAVISPLLADVVRLFYGDISTSRYTMRSVVVACLYTFVLTIFQRLRWERDRIDMAFATERQARLEAELAALHARLSPHFLFNTLNTIASLIPTEPLVAEQTVERLSSLLRYALDESRQNTVPLARELEVLEDYLNVQTARFGDRFTWDITMDASANAARVPPLSLQRLVENAILHGVANRRRGGRIEVMVEQRKGDVLCAVRDNGGDGHQEIAIRPGTGTALHDLREVLRINYGERGSLSTTPIDGGGYLALLTVPST